MQKIFKKCKQDKKHCQYQKKEDPLSEKFPQLGHWQLSSPSPFSYSGQEATSVHPCIRKQIRACYARPHPFAHARVHFSCLLCRVGGGGGDSNLPASQQGKFFPETVFFVLILNILIAGAKGLSTDTAQDFPPSLFI